VSGAGRAGGQCGRRPSVATSVATSAATSATGLACTTYNVAPAVHTAWLHFRSMVLFSEKNRDVASPQAARRRIMI
jgi:hypothetical protein